jgi:hypothetical protein
MSGRIGPQGFISGNKLVLVTNTSLSYYPLYSLNVKYIFGGSSNFTIFADWGDGTSDTYSGNTQYQPSHTYANQGIYTITFTFPNPELVTTFTNKTFLSDNNYAVTSISSFSIFSNLSIIEIYDSFSFSLTSPINLFYNNKLTSILVKSSDIIITLPITNTIEIIQIEDNLMTSIDLSPYPNLSNIELILPNVTSINLLNNPLLIFVTVYSSGITTLDLTNQTSLQIANISYNSFLSSITMPSYVGPGLVGFNSIYNNLPTSNINEILYALDYDRSGASNTCYLYGQTPSAPPDNGPPDGLLAVSDLLGNGWDVQTD